VDAAHVVVGGNVPGRFGPQGDAGAATQSQCLGPLNDGFRADFQSGLVEPCVARLGESLGEGELSGVTGTVVAEIEIADLETARTADAGLRRDQPGLQCGESDKGLEGRAGRVGRTEGPRVERNGRVVVELGENIRLDDGNESVGIKGRPRGHAEDFSGIRVDHHDGTAAAGFGQGVLAGFLHGEVQGGYDIVSRDRLLDDSLRGALAFGVEGEVEHAGCAAQLVVEDLLEAFPSLGIGEDKVPVFDRFDREGGNAAGVPHDMGGDRPERVMPEVGVLENEAGTESAAYFGHVLVGEIFGQNERKDAAVVVMLDKRFVGDIEGAAEQLFRGENLPAGEVDRLSVGEFEGGGKAEAEIEGNAGLGQRGAVAVGDLSARGRHIKEVGAGLFLGFPSGPWYLHHIGEALLGGSREGEGQKDDKKTRHFHAGAKGQ